MVRYTNFLVIVLPLSLNLPRSECISQKNTCSKIDAYPISFISSSCYHNPDVLSDVISTTTRHGYKIETYYTITPDGYILTLFRIPPKIGDGTKPPVFLQHGFGTTSGELIDIANRSLAFNLVDIGHEVWLGNFRGSTYSREHVTYSINSNEFWNFSLDDLAKYDLAIQLAFVANNTGRGGEIIYIGHSMGTTTIIMFASEYPEEAGKLIKGIYLLAPIVYLKGAPLATVLRPIAVLAYYLSPFRGLFYQEPLQNRIIVPLCRLIPRICRLVVYIFGRSVQFLPDDLPLFFTYFPSGISVKIGYHYAQIISSDKFRKFDYGEKKNLERYGNKEPPLYDLSKLTLPLYLFYGTRDTYYTQKNLERLYNEAGSGRKYKTSIPVSNDSYAFSHMDFVYAAYLKQFLYEELFNRIEELYAA